MPRNFIEDGNSYLSQINAALNMGKPERIIKLLQDNHSLKTAEQNFDNSPIIKLIDSNIASRVEILKKLISKGADITIEDLNGTNILQYLIYKFQYYQNANDWQLQKPDEFYELIEVMLANNSNIVHTQDKMGMNAIAKAVELGNVKLTEFLLEQGADCNSKLWGEKEHSLLNEAINQRNIPMIRLLLKQQDIKIEHGIALEIFEIAKGNDDLKKDFTKYVHITDRQLKLTLLNKAVEQNKPELLNGLGKHGLKIFDSKTLQKIVSQNKKHLRSNHTLQMIKGFIKEHRKQGLELIEAIDRRDTNKALKLIDEGCWPNVITYSPTTALLRAVINRNHEVTKALVRAGADINAKNHLGDTGLILAASQGSFNIVEELLNAGAEVNNVNNFRETALLWAVRHGNVGIVESLIVAGAHINLPHDRKNKSFRKNTILIEAVENGRNDIAKILIRAGADVNIENMCDDTALTIAAKKGLLDVVKELLDAGANINHRGLHGHSTLAQAAFEGRGEVVKELLNRGANADDISSFNLNVAVHDQEIKEMVLKKSKKHVTKRLNQKMDARIENAFNQLLERQDDIEATLVRNKLYKYIEFNDKHKELFKEKVKEVEEKAAKMNFKDMIESLFRGEGNVRRKKALRDIKKSLHNANEHKVLYEKRLAEKLNKHLGNNKGKSL